MNELLLILLDQQTEQSGGSAWSGMVMIVAMIVIFYFFMIRPQNKKQKELKKARESMKKGDKIVSAGGIHGRIKELKDNVVMMEVAPGVVIKIDKASVFADPTPASAPAKEGKGSAGKEDREKVVEDAGADLEEAAGKLSGK